MREFLYIDQLAALTPWTPAAIRTMMTRGVFKEGVHFFRPNGTGSRPIFKWAAVVKYIEEGVEDATDGDKIAMADGTVVELR